MLNKASKWVYGTAFKIAYKVNLGEFIWSRLNENQKHEALYKGYSIGEYRNLSKSLLGKNPIKFLNDFNEFDELKKQLIISVDEYNVIKNAASEELLNSLWDAACKSQKNDNFQIVMHKSIYAEWEGLALKVWSDPDVSRDQKKNLRIVNDFNAYLSVIKYGWVELGEKMRIYEGDIHKDPKHKEKFYLAFSMILAKNFDLAQEIFNDSTIEQQKKMLAINNFEILYIAAKEGNEKAVNWILDKCDNDLKKLKHLIISCFTHFYEKDKVQYGKYSNSIKEIYKKNFDDFVKIVENIESKNEYKLSFNPTIFIFPQIKSPIELQKEYELNLNESKIGLFNCQSLSKTIRTIKPITALSLTFLAGATFNYVYPQPLSYLSVAITDYALSVPILKNLIRYATGSNLAVGMSAITISKIIYDRSQYSSFSELFSDYGKLANNFISS